MDEQSTRRSVSEDIGRRVIEFVCKHMSIDEEWTIREDRGFTWWGDWVRQRVWADEAVESHGDTLWHVRARTPVYAGLPDESATYALVQDMNGFTSFSAYVYDPSDGTVSARCGAFVYDEIAAWVEKYVLAATGLQSSFAWKQGPAQADGRSLDDEAHPSAGRPEEPDDMLNAVAGWEQMPCPITLRVLAQAAITFASEGLVAVADPDDQVLKVLVPPDSDEPAMWMIGPVVHPVLGPGAGIRLMLPGEFSLHQGAWLANALNLAESGDWQGEDRPHAFGAWRLDGRLLAHDTFVPASVLGELSDGGAMLALRNFLAWGAMRAKSAKERLPWLMTAARSRYPDDELADLPSDQDAEEPFVPYDERSFGPGSRTRRPRPETPASHDPVELVVDLSDADAYAEIDAAVESAEDGDTIIVRPGTYRTPVVVDRAVTIRGDGPRDQVRLEPIGGEAIGFAASGAIVSGLTIKPALAGNDGALHSAVAVHNVQVTVEDCDLSTHLGATVWLGGPSSHVLLERCAIHDGTQNAIWVTEEGRAEVRSCRVTGHRWPLLVGGEHASLTVRDSEVLDNYDQGIAAMSGATLVVEGCTVSRNAGHGVLLLGAAPASRVTDNTLDANGGAGVFVEASRGRVSGNRISDNELGIGVMGGAPILEGNLLCGNGLGIGVRGEGADPRVRGNTIEASRREGVIVDQTASGRFDANSVQGCERAGIWVTDKGSSPRFTGNHVSGGAIGIAATNGGGGKFRSNDLRGNADGSWYLDGPGPLTRENNLEDSGRVLAEGADPDADAPAGSNPPTLVN